jgi:hypothetical protein
MEEKRSKEEESKRRLREQELREEQRFREEVERERMAAVSEGSKKQESIGKVDHSRQ